MVYPVKARALAQQNVSGMESPLARIEPAGGMLNTPPASIPAGPGSVSPSVTIADGRKTQWVNEAHRAHLVSETERRENRPCSTAGFWASLKHSGLLCARIAHPLHTLGAMLANAIS